MSTTVETPVAPDAPTEDVEHAGPARWLGDGLAVLLLAVILVHLEDHDGGLEIGALRWVGVVAAIALPAVVGELRRLPSWFAWLLGLWAVGTAASVLFGEIRAFALEPALIHAIVPVVFLAARRVWARAWGPAALLGLVILALGLYWQRSFLQWWGANLNGQQPIWLSLSWHNQSGMLMGALGLIAFGMTVIGTRLVRWGSALLAAGAFAGTWLSSSRGAILVTAVAAAILVVARTVQTATRRGLPVVLSLAVLAGTFGIGTVLLGMDQREAATTPLDSRLNTVAETSSARVDHVEAAVGMFLDRPITGQGLGSYRETARPFTDPSGSLTSSAHNEYAENLGEGGLLLGGTFLLLSAAAAFAALGALRRPLPEDPVRAGVQLGCAGVVLAIGAHAGLDFDWAYLVLPSLFAVATAVVIPDRVAAGARGPAVWTATGTVAVLLLATTVGVSAQIAHRATQGELTPEEFAETPWPLDLRAHVDVGYRLWQDDHDELAREVAERGSRWNPGSTWLATLTAIVRFEQGELAAGELAGSLREGWSRFDEYTYVASSLIDAGELTLAAEVLDRQRTQLAAHTAWGVTETARSTWPVVVELEARRGGCDAARAAAERALDDGLAGFPEAVTTDDVIAAAGVDC